MRAVLFGLILLSGAVPMTQAANVFGREQAARQMGWWWLVVEACCYVVGAVIYAVSSDFPPFDLLREIGVEREG